MEGLAAIRKSYTRMFRSVEDPQVRLFCFPHAGVGATIYASWHRLLPRHIEVCPIQLPGRESRLDERAFERIQPLVVQLTQVLDSHLDLPFALFGESLGSLVAYELARGLRRDRGVLPRHLFVGGFPAPHLPHSRPSIHHLPHEEFIDTIRSWYDGVPAEILEDAEGMKLFAPLLKADFALFETYRYVAEAPLECPITCFGGRQDSTVGKEELGAWADHSRSEFALEWLPGGHFNVRSGSDRIVQVIADALPSA